jgi:oxaloacetate decarboxylase alpha subunit/pyruvate carboxylase subunit B
MHLLSDTKISTTDINVLLHQTPGGMLSNLVNQLREMNALNRIDEVYAELPKVRNDLGQIPLVTPTSQIVGVQTVNNVLFDESGERYKRITDQVKDLCFGLYGKTTEPIDPALMKKALKDYPLGENPITCRPGSILEPELQKAQEGVNDLAKSLEDVLIYALYPVTGKRFLRWKYGKEKPPAEVKPKTLDQIKAEQNLIRLAKEGKVIPKPEKEIPARGERVRTFNVFVDGEYFSVEVDEARGAPNVHSAARQPLRPAPAQASKAPAPSAPPPSEPAAGLDGTPLTAPMPGMIISVVKKVGDPVKQGETLVILEAMKMENALQSPANGTLKAIHVSAGDTVKKDTVLCVIG